MEKAERARGTQWRKVVREIWNWETQNKGIDERKRKGRGI